MSLITLFHGTSSIYKKDIEEKGILPKNQSLNEGNWLKHPSRQDMVYLTDTYPIYFGVTALKDIKDENVIIYKVEVEKDFLYPDEDFIFSIYKDIDKRLNFKKYVIDYKFLWKDSLNLLGTVGHQGEISPSHILDSVELSLEEDIAILVQGIQPSISFENKYICGGYYQDLTKSLFK